jgi:hypothetical protein
MRHLLIVLAIALAAVGCGGVMPPPSDGGSDGGGDGGLFPFGAPCADKSECASNVCFIGGNRTFCSLVCTVATQATDCPVPPTSGLCNMQGYCKP